MTNALANRVSKSRVNVDILNFLVVATVVRDCPCTGDGIPLGDMVRDDIRTGDRQHITGFAIIVKVGRLARDVRIGDIITVKSTANRVGCRHREGRFDGILHHIGKAPIVRIASAVLIMPFVSHHARTAVKCAVGRHPYRNNIIAAAVGDHRNLNL